MMINHRKNWLIALLAVAVAAVLPAAGATAKSASGLTSFHGKVASVSTAAKTFRLQRANGSTLTFKVTNATVFQRLGGTLSALRAGRAIEVKGKRVNGGWVASKVEPDTNPGDDNGGSGGGGADDGPNHT
jgi:hypothetical protein